MDFDLSSMMTLFTFGMIVVDLFACAEVTDLVEVVDKASADIDEESD